MAVVFSFLFVSFLARNFEGSLRWVRIIDQQSTVCLETSGFWKSRQRVSILCASRGGPLKLMYTSMVLIIFIFFMNLERAGCHSPSYLHLIFFPVVFGIPVVVR